MPADGGRAGLLRQHMRRTCPGAAPRLPGDTESAWQQASSSGLSGPSRGHVCFTGTHLSRKGEQLGYLLIPEECVFSTQVLALGLHLPQNRTCWYISNLSLFLK